MITQLKCTKYRNDRIKIVLAGLVNAITTLYFDNTKIKQKKKKITTIYRKDRDVGIKYEESLFE